MTAHDLEQPRMIYTGDIPPHLTMRPLDAEDDETYEADFEPPVETRRAILPIALATGAALAVGIAIGVFAPALFGSPSAPPPTPQPVLQPATVPPEPLAPTAPAPAAPLPQTTLAQAPPHAAAKAPSAPIRLAVARVSSKPAGPWRPIRQSDKSCAPYACPDPAITVAENDLQQAYQRARGAGLSADQLRAGQIEWLIARQAAANRSPDELAGAYRKRIAQLNALADNEPPH